MNLLTALIVLFISNTAIANSYKYDALNVEGEYSPKELTRVEKMKLLREKLERQNEALVKKQVEQMRLQSELLLMKKIKAAFDAQLQALK